MLTGLAAIAVAHIVAEPHVSAECHVTATAGNRAVPQFFTLRPTGAVTRMNVFRVIEGD